MAKYSAFKYGTSETYGTAGATEGGEVTWVLMVDWDGDGIFDGTNEASRLVDVQLKRGSEDYLNPSGKGFTGTKGGRAMFTLENYDRRYDPRCSTSPLYPNVAPGKEVYLRVIENSDQTNHDVLKGVIADIRPLSEGTGGGRVRMIVNDYAEEIFQSECTKDASASFIDLDAAFARVLSDIGYKKTSAIDADNQPVPMLDISNKSAGSVVNDLAEAGLGYFFVDRLGVAKYYDRSHSSYTNHSIDEDVILKEILVSQPWDYVYNHVSVMVHRPIWKQPSVVYSLPNPEQITTGSNVTLRPVYRLSKDITVGNIEGNTEKDGNGTDISDDLSVVSQSLGDTGGTITISTATNGYITRLELKGRLLEEVREDSVAEDTASQPPIKKLSIDSPYMQDPHFANSFSTAIKDVVKSTREGIVFEIQQRPGYQYPLDIMHSIAFTSATLDLDDTYYITGYEHRWNAETGQDVTTTVWLHSLIQDDSAITRSEIEEENYVPPTLETPPEDPWNDPPDPPEPEDEVPGVTAGIDYVFIPALGGEDGNETEGLAWGGSDNCGGTIGTKENHAGVWLFSTLASGAYAGGAFVVPKGVTNISLLPIVNWGDLLPSGAKVKFRHEIDVSDLSLTYHDAGAGTIVDWTYLSTPSRGYYSRVYLLDLIILNASVQEGYYIDLYLSVLSSSSVPVGWEFFMLGWKAFLS